MWTWLGMGSSASANSTQLAVLFHLLRQVARCITTPSLTLQSNTCTAQAWQMTKTGVRKTERYLPVGTVVTCIGELVPNQIHTPASAIPAGKLSHRALERAVHERRFKKLKICSVANANANANAKKTELSEEITTALYGS